MARFLSRISKLFQKARPTSLEQLEGNLGYRFQNIEYLTLALSHRSYTHSKELSQIHSSNERLEFLGDAVLELVMTEHLYREYPGKREGTLSKMKSLVVSAKVLAICAKRWSLGDFIYLSRAEDKAGGRERVSILADTFEAVLGAVYLDGGLVPVRKLIEGAVISGIEEVLNDTSLINYKSQLLEYSQSKGLGAPEYQVQEEWGPEHKKQFRVAVLVSGEVWGRGEGPSKKNAEQAAARVALETKKSQETPP